MEKKLKQFEGAKASVVAVSVDSPEKSAELVKKLSLTVPLLSDVDLKTIKAYGVEDSENGTAWPAIYIIGPNRQVRWRSLVENYKIRPAADVVLEALKTAPP